MRIKKIKLAGFKSFVDPLTIPMEASLIGIVGPNGCGKSNVIDAVRWVMGESSAKQLRGDSMADVIFNGSTSRKPVGKASVEIIFDNSDGSAPGQYAGYGEISIKREAGRDGTSDYFLNRTKCRRKDIIDLFLGTGAGPHAYSIIEQGMVTRIIESKPEDLRSMFEEAAGVSRYKERRRETENRIRHTRENLSRVEDIRKELETQLNRLQRQSRAAQRYKEMKQEERTVRAQLRSLRWKGHDDELRHHDSTISSREVELEGVVAALRAIEAEVERLRVAHAEGNDQLNEIQAEFYSAGAEVTGIEQSIQHARETREQHLREREQLERARQEVDLHQQGDRQKLADMQERLEQLGPLIAGQESARTEAAHALESAERAMHEWQTTWEVFGHDSAEPARIRDVESARIKSLDGQVVQLRERQSRLQGELHALDEALQDLSVDDLRREVTERDASYAAGEQELEDTERRIRESRTTLNAVNARLEELRGELQKGEARLAGLKELQAAAFGQHDAALNDWLAHRGLTRSQRLAGLISVDAGWERAVERILDTDLAAVCVESLDRYQPDIENLSRADLTLLESGSAAETSPGRWTSLLSKLRATADLAPLLSGIYVADSLDEALRRRRELAAHESLVTRDGVWVGRNWLSVSDRESERAGILGREREMENLVLETRDWAGQIESIQQEQTQATQQIAAYEGERDERRRLMTELNRERAAVHARLGHDEAHLAQQQLRRQQIEIELSEIAAQIGRASDDLKAAQSLVATAESQVGSFNDRRQALLVERDRLRAALEQARIESQSTHDRLNELRIEQETHRTALESVQQSLGRLDSQLEQLASRRHELDALLVADGQPETEMKARLEAALAARQQIEARVATARQSVGDLDAALREQEQARHGREREIEEAREVLQQDRIHRQELVVRRDTIADQVREDGLDPSQVLAETPAEATIDTWQSTLDELTARIERLGPINLVAIDEFEEQSTRKEYLDKQHEDLSQALTTLEDAIRKIDRETRTRFRETFDKVNTSFQSLFPKLFGGGHAYLELIGEDILDTGVRVMARPPGKRNSTIHLLSGGEKALTAVSLLFALFELNPAPFCFLDEVDAPLDDANVVRYSDMIKALSQRTQLVYITHNKITMEIADLLVGVTMSEPGVSRLVAVDVEAALEMVAES